MSSNIFKSGFVKFTPENTKVIDNDAIVQKRMGLIPGLVKEQEGSATAGPESVYTEEEEGLDPDTLNALTGNGDGFSEGFGDFAGSVSGDSDRIIGGSAPAGASSEEIQQACDDIIANAKAQASSIIAGANEEAASIRLKASEDGFKEGYDKGTAEAAAQLEAKSAEFDRMLEQNRQEYEDLIASLEPRMVEVITTVYSKVFSMGFYNKRDVLVALISKALLSVDSDEKIVIHVSSADYDTVMEAKDRLFTSASFSTEPQIRARESLESGQAKVETPYGIMDCSIDTELKELERTLMLLAHS